MALCPPRTPLAPLGRIRPTLLGDARISWRPGFSARREVFSRPAALGLAVALRPAFQRARRRPKQFGVRSEVCVRSRAPDLQRRWEALEIEIMETEVSQDLLQIEKEIATGVRCHPDTEARVFSASHPNAPVTFYRDGSALCPDCQAVWLLLEAKEINYTVVKEDLRAHGRKSEEFLRKVPSGSLPAIEARGRWATNSLDAMFLLEHLYPNPLKPMFPSFSRLRLRALELLELHRALMNAWSTYMFREEKPFLNESAVDFQAALEQVQNALENSDTRWFLPYQHPSIVDIQYVCSMERIVASAMFFKAMDLREMFPRIDEWLGELEKLPWYRATKGDFYSHCMALAPRYGPAVPVMLQRSQRIRDQLMPANYPLPFRFERDMEALLESDRTQRLHHVEASWALLKNRDSLVRYMCRAAGGQLGLWARNRRDRSQLADPEAAVLEPLLLPLEVLLCTVAEASGGW